MCSFDCINDGCSEDKWNGSDTCFLTATGDKVEGDDITNEESCLAEGGTCSKETDSEGNPITTKEKCEEEKDGEKTEIDTEGFMYWCQFTFHKELIDVLLQGKEDMDKVQNEIKQLQNMSKSVKDDDKKKQCMALLLYLMQVKIEMKKEKL